MTKKILFLLVSMTTLSPFAFSQKAYDAIYYTGKTQNITVNFTMGDGYLSACAIKTTDNKTKKSSRFLPDSGHPDAQGQMKFLHFSKSKRAFSDYFIISGLSDEMAQIPTKLYGKYYYEGKSYDITLTKL